MRIALAANTASGGGLDPEPLVEAMRSHGADVTLYGCEPDELERIAEEPPDRIAVAGGDGTIGAAALTASKVGVPLAVIPMGTANDYARSNELPDDPVEAAELAATGEHTRPLELGRLADGRPFVNVASAGLAAEAARYAQPFKKVLGPLAYAAGAIRAAAVEHPLDCTIRVDGETAFDGGAWQVIVSVSGAFGGGSQLDEPDPGDGVLDVTVIRAGSRLALARRAWGMRRGNITEQRSVEHHLGCVVEISLPRGTELNVDGEIREGGLERVSVKSGAYALVVPDGASSTPSRPQRLTS